jgi:8-oxo-dGTP pyrophosphatase MutT (NUDIX family)
MISGELMKLRIGQMQDLEVQTKYRGRIVTVNVETVTLPNGARAALDIVHHPGGAAVVAIDDEERVCMLRQYRHAAGGWIWELPAGKLDTPEPGFACAQRELIEEAGRTARRWDPLGVYFSSPGVFTEQIHLFLARDLQVVPAALEAHEVLEVHWIPLQEAWRKAVDGEYEDGKTLVGLLRAAARLQLGSV